MPPVRTSRNRKPPPDGFEDIEDTLLEFSNKMRDTENSPHEGKRRNEVLWPIFQITHQRLSSLSLTFHALDDRNRYMCMFQSADLKAGFHSGQIGSRYIYELYYDKEAISKTLYDWLLKNSYADANLIAKWKKQGYEKVNICLPPKSTPS